MGFLQNPPKSIWVGTSSDRVVLYDPGFQMPDYPYLFLWEPTTRAMGRYSAEVAGRLLVPLQGPEASRTQFYIAAYQEWQEAHGEQWLSALRDEHGKWLNERRLAQEKEAQAHARREKEASERLEAEREELERRHQLDKEWRLARERDEHERWDRREVERLARVSAEAQRNEPATKGDCYITMANAKAMYDGIDLQKLGNVDTDQVFSADLSKILSANEQRWLVAARMLYEDFALFIEHAYSKDRRTSDGLRFARKKAPPAYHLDHRCDNLHSDFEEFLIPVEVDSRGDAEVERFRAWFLKHEELLARNPDAFIARAVIEFRLNGPKSMELVIKPNSGVTEVRNVRLDTINAKIGMLLRDAEKLRSEHHGAIRSYELQWRQREPDEPLIGVEAEWVALKKSIKQELRTYFQVRFNPELRFEGRLLEQIGFRPCSVCARSRANSIY